MPRAASKYVPRDWSSAGSRSTIEISSVASP